MTRVGGASKAALAGFAIAVLLLLSSSPSMGKELETDDAIPSGGDHAVAIKPGEQVVDHSVASKPRAGRHAASTEPVPDFVPTGEWQEILPGQAVPEGLHIRMDLQTGKKEAKLIDPKDEETATVAANITQAERGDIEARVANALEEGDGIVEKQRKTLHPHLSDEEVQELMARTWAKKYEALFMTTEVDRMKEVISVLVKPNWSEDPGQDVVVDLLDELEEIVHQVDHGKDMCTLGGMVPLISFLKHRNPVLQNAAARVIAAAVGNNEGANKAALEAGVMPVLIEQLSLTKENNNKVMAGMLYALSSLLRHSSRSQEVFMSLDGPQILGAAVEAADPEQPGHAKLLRRAFALVHDIATAEPPADRAATKKAPEHIPNVNHEPVPGELDPARARDVLAEFQGQLSSDAWCKRVAAAIDIASAPASPNTDLLTDLILSAHAMNTRCKSVFNDVGLASILKSLVTKLDAVGGEWATELAGRVEGVLNECFV